MRGVYLIHFLTPYKHARHYTGYANDIDDRLKHHAAGQGARLMEVIKENNINWVCVRRWPGATRNDERKLKNSHQMPRLCPICNPSTAARPQPRKKKR